MTISILGCGWFGSQLAKSLIGQGYNVKGSTTSPGKLLTLMADGIPAFLVNITADEGSTTDPEFFRCDVLVVSITTRDKDDTPYPDKIDLIAALAGQHQIKRLIFISSIGVYGDHNETVNELTPPRPEKKAGELLLAAEQTLQSNTAFSIAVIRFGGLVGPDRNPGNFFKGKTGIPNGLAPVNLIHLDDCIAITEQIIQSGPDNCTINAVAPDHPAKGEFYITAATVSGSAIPGFVSEKKQWKIVQSVLLDDLNYRFKICNWMEWLDNKDRA